MVAVPSAAFRAAELLERLAALGNQTNRAGMARYGIPSYRVPGEVIDRIAAETPNR